MHLTATLLGATSLLVALGVKYTPERFLKKFPQMQEDEDFLKKTQAAINKQAAMANLE